MKIVVTADIHADADVLDRIIVKEKHWDAFIFAGDAVGQGNEPNEVVETLRGIENLVAVMGNWDYAVVRGRTDMTRREEDLKDVLRMRRELSKENMHWLQMLPLVKKLELGGRRITILHGSPDSILYGHIYPWTDKTTLRTFLRENGEILIVGHTHIPLIFEWETQKYGKRIIINPGSPSFPEGGSRRSYAVIETDGWKIKMKTL